MGIAIPDEIDLKDGILMYNDAGKNDANSKWGIFF